jgi:hypothetical protein
MKGPRDLKRYVAKHKRHIKACHGDDLFLFKMERCKKWRKQNRRSRDGSYGTHAQPLSL